MRRTIHSAFLGAAVLNAVAAAQPILKTGNCPELTRYRAPAGENWNGFLHKPNGFEAGTIQNPLTPQQSINCIQVPQGLRAELWASELTPGVTPALAYIQHFTFDERGRMWAVEPRSYPNIIRPASGSVTDQKFQGGLDRILILEDTDGDKVADEVKVFKDGLNLPQGIEVVNGGVVVAMAPYLVFFPNDNDAAGTPQILFGGMGVNGNFDTHGGISSLMYGLDNWIYGHSGYNSCSVNINGSNVNCGVGKVWRFRHKALGHDTTRFEIWTSGKANAWGIGQMEDGQIFQSGATGDAKHIYHSIRKGAAAVDIRSGGSAAGLFYPITGDRYLYEGSTAKTNGIFTSPSTAVSGMQFYTSRLLPRKYWNRFAFACEGASKLCNQDSLVVSANGGNTGSSWQAVRLPPPGKEPNLIASTDAWVAPILAKTGPDGAVWVLDWYNYLFLHNPISPPGDGNAWQNQLREKSRVRIYRVTPADGRTETVLDLANATTAELVETFANPNLHWRLQAQRLLLKKGWSAELGAALEAILAQDRSVDSVGGNPRVVHALWTLHGLGRFESEPSRWNPVLARLLAHPAWGVRRNALRAMPRTAPTAQAIDSVCTVNDPHGHVRLQALIALAEVRPKPALTRAMWDAYRDVDGTSGDFAHAANAFAAASAASGLASAATRPCEPAFFVPISAVPDRAAAQPRSDLRIVPARGGYRLLPHGGLPDGELVLSDARGRAVFRSAYRAREGRWTAPETPALGPQVYLYAFSGRDGSHIRGRLAPAGRL